MEKLCPRRPSVPWDSPEQTHERRSGKKRMHLSCERGKYSRESSTLACCREVYYTRTHTRTFLEKGKDISAVASPSSLCAVSSELA